MRSAPRRLRFGIGGARLGEIGVDRADGRVELGERDGEPVGHAAPHSAGEAQLQLHDTARKPCAGVDAFAKTRNEPAMILRRPHRPRVAAM